MHNVGFPRTLSYHTDFPIVLTMQLNISFYIFVGHPTPLLMLTVLLAAENEDILSRILSPWKMLMSRAPKLTAAAGRIYVYIFMYSKYVR